MAIGLPTNLPEEAGAATTGSTTLRTAAARPMGTGERLASTAAQRAGILLQTGRRVRARTRATGNSQVKRIEAVHQPRTGSSRDKRTGAGLLLQTGHRRAVRIAAVAAVRIVSVTGAFPAAAPRAVVEGSAAARAAIAAAARKLAVRADLPVWVAPAAVAALGVVAEDGVGRLGRD